MLCTQIDRNIRLIILFNSLLAKHISSRSVRSVHFFSNILLKTMQSFYREKNVWIIFLWTTNKCLRK